MPPQVSSLLMRNTPVLDKQFHKDAIDALRAQDPTVALVFGFENTQHRSLAANLLCLSYELENAIHIPKEPMLAAIRVQWWYDTLAEDDNKLQVNIAPLIVRLRIHIRDAQLKRDDLLTLIEAWQACAMDETASITDAWGECWRLVGKYLGDDKFADTAKEIAILLHATKTSDRVGNLRLDDLYFYDLREQAKKSRQWWLYFAAILGYHRHDDRHAFDDDLVLIWRLLGWRLFGFKTPH